MRLFLGLAMEQLMSVVHLRMKLVFELSVPLVVLLGYLLPEDAVPLVLNPVLVLYMSRKLGPRSPCTHSFSITGGL